MSDDIVERLRSPEVFIDHGGMFSPVAYVAADEITRLRTELAAVTAKRDRLQIMHDEAYISGMKHGWNCCAAGEEERYKNSIENIREQIRRARAALEGVTEKSGAGNE